jgi:hypothetical protein
MSNRTCNNCESAEDPDHKLQACARCKLVAYCSKACQVTHWKNGHKQACVALEDRKPQLSPQNGLNEAHVHMCVICLESVKQPSEVCTLQCSHVFHGRCVSNLRSQAASQVCPLCRTDLPPGPEQALAESMKLLLSVMYKTSPNESEDMGEVIRLATCAAEEGHIEAQMFLGQCFKGFGGMEKDEVKAFHWFMKAAEQGDLKAQCNVGCAYDKGDGVKQNKVKAFQWWLKAAEQGYVEAQFNVGGRFNFGGVKQDRVKAFEWWLKAAEQGYVEAQYNVGLCFDNGVSVKQDKVKPFEWWLKAAEQGYVEAQLCFK